MTGNLLMSPTEIYESAGIKELESGLDLEVDSSLKLTGKQYDVLISKPTTTKILRYHPEKVHVPLGDRLFVINRNPYDYRSTMIATVENFSVGPLEEMLDKSPLFVIDDWIPKKKLVLSKRSIVSCYEVVKVHKGSNGEEMSLIKARCEYNLENCSREFRLKQKD